MDNPQLDFDGSISRETLCAYLSRAVTCNNAPNSASLDDDLRMVGDVGALFLGRAAYVWVPEPDDEAHFANARCYAARVHQRNPRVICQACVFEAVYPTMDSFAVPAWVFEELGEEPVNRNFRYADCFTSEFRECYYWGRSFGDGCQVPDIRCEETRRWMYYRCRRYIDAGYEAIHMGQIHLYAGRDEGYRLLSDLLERVRDYARVHARRHLVILDAHTHGVTAKGRLLFDLHTRPISARPDREHPERIVLHVKGHSLGGLTPSGWRCDHLPYLIEVDNWGGYSVPPDKWADTELRASTGRWGWDDIAWFAHQDDEARNHFIEYAHLHSRLCDPVAYFQPPLRRLLGQAPVRRTESGVTRDIWHYQANRPSVACPDGFGQEDTIRRVWNTPLPSWVDEYHRAVAGAGKAGHDGFPEIVTLVGSLQKPFGGTPGDSLCPHSRLYYVGGGTYQRAAVIPWPGEYSFAIAVGGTMTEVYRQGNLCGGKPYVLRALEPNTVVRLRFDLPRRHLTVHDASGRSVLAEESQV